MAPLTRPLLHDWWPVLAPLAAYALCLMALPAVAAGGTIGFSLDWVPSLGISLSFMVDGLALLFALLISTVGLCVMVFAGGYLAGEAHLGRFYLYMHLFMAGMLGLVLAANLITLFVFWELTTVASYLLIGFKHEKASARRAALQALLITAIGGLCLLAGIILLGDVAGGYDFATILGQGEQIRAHPLYGAILTLILIGAFTKSAQIPFYFWLPNAMAAPTPVSAYLHSATMVKAGIYLLARLHPALAGAPAWTWTLTIIGAGTAIITSIMALRQTDLKLILAYTTLMALGTLTMFLGSEATIAVAAAMTFLIVHSLYKASLFMVAGIIEKQTGSRDLQQLGGLARFMPFTTAAAGAAAFSMAGFPPFLGFIGKELKYEGALAVASEPLLVAGAAVMANALMVAAAGVIAIRPFYGARRETPIPASEAPARLWIAPLLLAGLGLLFGVVPDLFAGSIVQPAVTAVLGRPEVVKLKLWHGVNIPLMLSIGTFVLGIGFYFVRRPLRTCLTTLEARLPTTADRLWDAGLDGLRTFAARQTHILQHGVLRYYLFTVFTVLVTALAAVFILSGAPAAPAVAPDLLIKEWAAVALTASGAILAVATQSRLTAICALGSTGVGVALIYLLFGAPDVAITQLLIETLFVVLAAAVLHRLPRLDVPFERRFRPAAAVLSIAAGVVVTLTVLAVLNSPLDRSVTVFYENASMPLAYGRNIVNVILVDFRAIDTFGEVVVVAVAAIGAFALLRGRRKGTR